MTSGVALYSAVDAVMTHYDVDVDAAELFKRSAIELPAKIQYAWPHPARRILYVTTSSAGPRMPSDHNHVSALAIGDDGALHPHGVSRPLPRRAVHVCVDPSGRYLLNAHNYLGGGVTVHRIEPDGTVGPEVKQSDALDAGTYPHQVMVFPSGRTALLVDRGNKAQSPRPEDPGALRCFGFADGRLSPGQVVTPGGGYGFGPRHVAFHPSKRWMYVSDERTNRLYMFRYAVDDRLEGEPAYTRPLLAQPSDEQPRQLAGAIHVHPSGRFLYVANRADHTVSRGDRQVFAGGENNIAVFSIHPDTGEPSLVQHADTHSFHVRTFACDPSGRLLVAASIKPVDCMDRGDVRTVPATLTLFRVDDVGRLECVRRVAVDTAGGSLQYWMGLVGA